jgi:hypothetical protein
MLPNASPLDTSTWLPVRQVLKAIKGLKLPAKTQVVLLLDSNRMDANWSLGLLYNGFADRLEKVVAEEEVSGLTLLNSASPGQIGWASPHLQGSVFGYFAALGLGGAADADRNGKVSLHELHAYLKRQIGRWALANRLDVQEPLLVTSNRAPHDFNIAWASANPPEQATAGDWEAAPADQPIDDFWRRHEKLQRDAAWRLDPLTWHDFQRKLIRLEQLRGGGSAYQREAGDLQVEIERVAASLEAPDRAELFRVHSLPLARCWSAATPPAASSTAAPPADLPTQPPPGMTYLDRAQAAWNWIREDARATPDNIDRTLKFAGRPEREGDVGLIELHFLEMLRRHLDVETWTVGAPAVARSVGLRQQGDETAAPVDPRVDYWIRGHADEADQARRVAEDLLFMGDAEACAKSATWMDQAAEGYRNTMAQSQQVAGALRTRDQAWSELPYLAQWLTRRIPPSQVAVDLQPLAEAIRANHQLDEAVARRAPASELATQAQMVADEVAALRKQYDIECSRLTEEAGEDQYTLRGLADALSVPLVTGDRRGAMRARLEKLEHERDLKPTAAGSQTEDAEAEASPTDALLDRLAAFPVHPALALLNLASSDAAGVPVRVHGPQRDGGEQLKSLCRQGGAVRELLEKLPQKLDQFARESNDKLKDPSVADAWRARAGYAEADRLARASGSLFVGTLPVRDREPSYQLRQLDLHQALIWNADRTLDDFWGPSVGGHESFFQSATNDYLQSAESLLPAAAGLRVKTATLLKNRVAAAAQGLQPTPIPSTIFLAGDDLSLQHSVGIRDADNLPDGVPIFFLCDSTGRAVPVVQDTREHRRVIAAERINYAILRRDLPTANESALRAVVLYRGHEYTAEIQLQTQAGVMIVTRRQEPTIPRITVYGQAKQHSSISFIFDCSGSMGLDVRGKEPWKSGLPTRMKTAKAALIDILGQVARARAYRVAVNVYAHRVGWRAAADLANKPRYVEELSEYGKKQEQRAREQDKPFNFHPANDVESVLEMGEFGPEENSRVGAMLSEVGPWGETPLYLAIIQALEHDFRDEADSTQRHIIVITDGQNDQHEDNPAGSARTLNNVREAFKLDANQRVRLDVVGFAINPAEEPELNQLGAIARATGGGYYPVNDPSELLKIIENSLGLSRFEIVDVAESKRIGPPRQLGDSVELHLDGHPLEVRARLLAADPPVRSGNLDILGGEWLKLFLSDDAHRLVHARYLGELEQGLRNDSQPTVADPLEPGRSCFIGIHLPQPQAGGIRFPVSIQNGDARMFSPRPAEAWAEFRPLSHESGEEFQPYVFYDISLEQQRPVPVLSYFAHDWPASAEKAEVRLWCKFARTEPDKQIELRSVGPSGTVYQPAPGTELRVQIERGKKAHEPDRVVVEQHCRPEELYDWKIELDPPATEASHTYYSQGGLVRHSFSSEPDQTGAFGEARLLITAARRVKDQAVALPKFEFTVPRAN